MSETLTLSKQRLAFGRQRFAAYLELTKPRIAVLVLVATAVGFLLGDSRLIFPPSELSLITVLVGTALVASGANALNQCLEAPFDAQMRRTADRPVPSGRLLPGEARSFGRFIMAAGVALLFLGNGPLAAFLAATTAAIYLFVYTPLKRVTALAVFAGAVPGAMPPLIGWAAATGTLTAEAWSLFAILFFWQMPHVASIGWLHRDDYRQAGYPVLPVVDFSGTRTDLHLMTHSVALAFASLLPAMTGLCGGCYALAAIVLAVVFLMFGIVFAVRRSHLVARMHMVASIVYLPALCLFMVLDRAVPRPD